MCRARLHCPEHVRSFDLNQLESSKEGVMFKPAKQVIRFALEHGIASGDLFRATGLDESVLEQPYTGIGGSCGFTRPIASSNSTTLPNGSRP